VLCAVLVLSACTSRVGGAPVAGTTLPDEPDELTAKIVFGDLPTVQPCSLTTPAVFDEFGEASFGAPESLDYCTVSVDTADGADVVLSIGAFGELSAEPELQGKRVEELDGGLWVGQQNDDPTFCSQLLVFPDEVTVQVSGSVYEGDADTCPMVEAGMEYVIGVVMETDVLHRSPERDSLVTVDPCSLADDEDVAAIEGLAGVRRTDEYPARHTCYWEAGGSSVVTVRLQFVAGPKPVGLGAGANEDPVAGRPSATNRYPEIGDNSYCAVETAHLPFEEVAGQDAFEVASVYVRMPAGQVEAGCAAARAVAELVWPKLPEA
jgi:hypothetical protein